MRARGVGAVSSDEWRGEYAKRLVERLWKALPEGTSHAELARRTGFHAETVRRYMKASTTLPADFVGAVCLTYGIDANEMLGAARAVSRAHIAEITSRVVQVVLEEMPTETQL